MCPCRTKRVWVQPHRRELPSGKATHVKGHSRDVRGRPRDRKLYRKVKRFYKKKGYPEERTKRIAGAVAYGPRE